MAFLLFGLATYAQTDSNETNVVDSSQLIRLDSLEKAATPFSDSAVVKKTIREHSPRKAAIRSLILPGLGQIYNKKYWKLPIVYGALGISGAVFNHNLKWYRRTRFAYKVLRTNDVQNFDNVHPQLKVFIDRNDASALQNYRDEFRRYIDYSVLAFVLLWGLNVVDATVDAHLKTFDVSSDLSFQMRFGSSELAGTTGVSLVFMFK